MTECSLIEEYGRAHFLTKRFDRINGEKFAVLLRLIFCMSATTMGKADKMDFRENDENWRRGVLGLPPEDEGGFGGVNGIALGLEGRKVLLETVGEEHQEFPVCQQTVCSKLQSITGHQ